MVIHAPFFILHDFNPLARQRGVSILKSLTFMCIGAGALIRFLMDWKW